MNGNGSCRSAKLARSRSVLHCTGRSAIASHFMEVFQGRPGALNAWAREVIFSRMSVGFHGSAAAGRALSLLRLPSAFSSLGSGYRSLYHCALVILLLSAAGRATTSTRVTLKPAPANQVHIGTIDNDLLDDISRRSFRYFWEQTNLHTGLVLDRANVNGAREDNPRHRGVASIAATGFGLTALCIGADHRWVSPNLVRQRVLTALKFFAYQAPHEHGWFYHYLDAETGERRWQSEISSIDTALLLAGVLSVRQFFHDDPEIVQLATAIYTRVDFPWMLHGSATLLSHGWTPESGFLPYRWDTYSEHMILYVLAIGSPTHPIAPAAWYTWKLPVVDIDGYSYIGGGPLFIQQYSQAWVDLRDRVPKQGPSVDYYAPRVNYFANSVAATRAQQAFSVRLAHRFPGYSSDIWGITASDSSKGYVAWGGSPQDPRIDGTVVPSAAGGSLMFAPDICIPALRAMLVRYGKKKIYGRYGFVDAFNPNTGWVSRYVIGIDVGITLLSAENLRTGKIWDWFMANTEAGRALDLVGLVSSAEQNSDARPVVSVQSPTATKLDSQTEIPIARNVEIPRSSFEFKILILPP